MWGLSRLVDCYPSCCHTIFVRLFALLGFVLWGKLTRKPSPQSRQKKWRLFPKVGFLQNLCVSTEPEEMLDSIFFRRRKKRAIQSWQRCQCSHFGRNGSRQVVCCKVPKSNKHPKSNETQAKRKQSKATQKQNKARKLTGTATTLVLRFGWESSQSAHSERKTYVAYDAGSGQEGFG